jgi:outer membrane receptor protein involved in Fe transport
MRIALLTLAVIGISFSLNAQTGEIQGKVVEPNGNSVPFANVGVFLNDVQVAGVQTDFDGFFSVKPLNAGRYKVSVGYFGKTVSVNDVGVSSGATTFLPDIVISATQEIKEVIIEYERPAIDVGKPDVGSTISREQVEKMPKNNLVGIIGNSGATYQQDDNSLINIAGSRSYATKYLVDGVDLTGVVELPPEAIDEVQIITGGIEAKQGDLTGGIVSISTRGPSKTYHGSIEALTSQYLDPFGYNQGRFSLLGPLYTKYKGTDTSKTVLGFLLTGEALYRKDTDPPGVSFYQVNEDVLNEIKENPLIAGPSGGLVKQSEFLTMEDLSEIPYRPNNSARSFDLFGKLDFKPSRSVNITFGTQAYHNYSNAYIRTFSLLNSDKNPITVSNDYRFYAKFTQRFLDKLSPEGEKPSSGYTLGNAYYTIQADYQFNNYREEDTDLGRNPFDYGYIGKFDVKRSPFYFFTEDTVTGKDLFTLLGYFEDGVTFTPGDVNPLMTRYTELFFENNPDVTSLSSVLAGGGLRNGDNSFSQNLITYSMYYNPGFPYTRYFNSRNDQFGFRFDASLDLKKTVGEGTAKKINKHALEFGFEYQQRKEASYGLSPIGLWTVMRQNANAHLADLDLANPYYIIEGDTIHYSEYTGQVGEFDTIFYYPLYKASEQRYFDVQLRKKLGLPVNGFDYINIDALDPDFFNITMFSPDELFLDGNSIVGARGYDVHGNKLKGQPSFADFFSKFNDENGNGVKDVDEYYTRDIDAYRPIYTAAYVQDRFNVGRVIFRVGLRVDRFDANQKVLRDQYSLYAIRTAGEVTTINNQPVTHPNTIGNDFAVYVDNELNPQQILGYRDGDTWYSAEGNEIFDPASIAAGSNTGTITPYLVDATQDIKDPDNFDPDLSFQDYTPQITVMPRIAFSFPITETAMFTAHYDVLTQRPFGDNEATAFHYYYMEQIAIDGRLPNPNLKPEKTINYQLGFQQALSDHSALKISAFYKELRDMMQVTRINYAYPVDYTTFGNVDFGTVKGMTVGYDLIRRVNNLLMSASYTLQFADGTGSSTTSQAGLIGAGQPQLRVLLPLSYDVRHTFNVNVDYRYGSGDDYNGPLLFGGRALQNTGVNVAVRARSGEPFTQQSEPTPTAMFAVAGRSTLEGKPNGSRLPWSFKTDMRLDKDFELNRSTAEKAKNPLYINVYLLVQNLFNNKNIVAVYRYTGSPTDDGFVSSAEGQELVQAQIDPDSFVDLYTIKMANPDNYAQPRRIQLGAKLKF